MNAFPIGTSALAAGQRGLELVGQNIANAATPGYHRQTINLVNRTNAGITGTGVDVASVTRHQAAPVRTAILRGNSEEAAASARLGVSRQMEATLATSPGGIADSLESFFNQVESLTTQPDNSAVRRPVISAAGDLAASFSSAAGDIDRLRSDTRGQIKTAVDEVNGFAQKIAELNVKISGIESGGGQANDLRDQRDQLVNDLSQRIDIRTVEQPGGVLNVMASGAAVVVGEYANTFALGSDASGNAVVTQDGSGDPLAFNAGTLGGLMQEHNQTIPAARARLDGLARELIGRVNAAHATGLGTNGPLTSSAGSNAVADPSAPLASQNLAFPPKAGQLVVSVTNTATGTRSNAAIAVDPSTQSLSDIASAITAGTGGNVQASVDPTTGSLRFDAQPGYQFDFAGRDTNPAGGGAVAEPDSANLLTALGVNGLFTGTSAASIGVRADIVANPNLLAASRSGQPGDGTNLERMAAVRDQSAVNGRTLANEFTDLTAGVGADVAALGDTQSAQSALLQNLSGQEQSVTGVDINEELVHLLDFQRMVEGASKYLSVVNSALDEVMNIIR